MNDIGIIGSSDGPTAIFLSSDDPNFLQSGGIIEEDNIENKYDEAAYIDEEESVDNTEEAIISNDINEVLNNRSLAENFDAGFKIMGIGMIAVFGVLTILYVVIKIMGQFAKNKDKDNSNEKN